MLAELHQSFGPSLEILIFPSDEFGAQELPEKQVPDFCESKGVPTNKPGCHLMAKVEVNGPNTHPVWALAKKAFPGHVNWNFDGIFTFDKTGAVNGRYSIRSPPSMDQIKALI